MEQLYPIRLLEEHTYALIDYVVFDDMPQEWHLIPLAPHGFENETNMFPALLSLEEMTSDQRMDLLDTLDQAHARGEPLPMATFLHSSADLEQMRMHWIRQLILALPNRQRAYLRSHDPRVFAQLQWMFTPAQLHALFGPISRWTVYLDRRWQTSHPPAHDGPAGGRVDPSQAARLARIGMINRVLFKLPGEQRCAHEVASRSIDALLVRASNHGLTREEEQVEFALHGMTIHPLFDRHPGIARLIAEFDRDEQTYYDAIAALDAAQWQRIAHELGRPDADPRTSQD